MTEYHVTSWYIATVWLGTDAYDVGQRIVVRLQAVSVEDYREQVYQAWPEKIIDVGPVSRSKVQG